jgi:hypothetical protein
MWDGRISLKISELLSLMEAFGLIPLSARFISTISTFKTQKKNFFSRVGDCNNVKRTGGGGVVVVYGRREGGGRL